jgi:tetratricopeptide (TPR) repeat protein
MDAGDWIAAAKRYAAGLALAPSSHQLRQNAAYLAQEWARGGLENGGMEGFLAAAMQAKATLPDHPGVSKAVTGVLFVLIEGQVESGSFEQAVESVGAASAALSDKETEKLYEFAYDYWAKSALDREDWRAALAIYEEGLARAPDSSLLKHNRKYAQSRL